MWFQNIRGAKVAITALGCLKKKIYNVWGGLSNFLPKKTDFHTYKLTELNGTTVGLLKGSVFSVWVENAHESEPCLSPVYRTAQLPGVSPAGQTVLD